MSTLVELGVNDIVAADSAELATETLQQGVDVAFVFLELRHQVALEIVRTATSTSPSPHVVIVSDGKSPGLFEFARAGARTHLLWPGSVEALRDCLTTTSDIESELELAIGFIVGRVSFKDAQSLVRRVMLMRALEASHGSRRRAAQILGVTRPAVQRMLREETCYSVNSRIPTDADEGLAPAIDDVEVTRGSGVFGLDTGSAALLSHRRH
ncbi:MAG TPA: helix-turn-helix domain-containing protein [Polyangiaceae bacterium]